MNNKSFELLLKKKRIELEIDSEVAHESDGFGGSLGRFRQCSCCTKSTNELPENQCLYMNVDARTVSLDSSLSPPT